MHWLTKEDRYPNDGETRDRLVFAWKPTKVGRHTVWLEWYEVRERFFQPANGNPGWWSETGRGVVGWFL